MLLVGFFFATVSGSLCGVIGSSNNSRVGITISTLADCRPSDGRPGRLGQAWRGGVLGVAAVVCVSSSSRVSCCRISKLDTFSAATPKKIQIAELISVVVASLVMYFSAGLAAARFRIR